MWRSGGSAAGSRGPGRCRVLAMDERCEVVVVGGGLLGLATGRALARRGREVIVLEQAETGHEAGGSKGSCRIFRLGYPDAGYVTMARRAREHWRALEDEHGERLLQPGRISPSGPGWTRSAGPCSPRARPASR